MLSYIIIFLLLLGFLVGYRRGFILQLVHLTSYFISFFIAVFYYRDFAEKLKLWIPYPTLGENETLQLLFSATNAESAYYHGIAFLIIFVAVKILLQIIGSMLDFLANIPIIKQLNSFGGALLGFIEVYLLIFIVLYIAALLPIEKVQMAIDQSNIAKSIIEHTPIFSKQIHHLLFGFIV